MPQHCVVQLPAALHLCTAAAVAELEGTWGLEKALEERDMALQYGLAVGQMSLRSNAPQGLRCRAQQCFCKDAHKLTFLAISSLEGCLWNQMSVTRPSELTTYLKMPAAGSMR